MCLPARVPQRRPSNFTDTTTKRNEVTTQIKTTNKQNIRKENEITRIEAAVGLQHRWLIQTKTMEVADVFEKWPKPLHRITSPNETENNGEGGPLIEVSVCDGCTGDLHEHALVVVVVVGVVVAVSGARAGPGT